MTEVGEKDPLGTGSLDSEPALPRPGTVRRQPPGLPRRIRSTSTSGLRRGLRLSSKTRKGMDRASSKIRGRRALLGTNEGSFFRSSSDDPTRTLGTCSEHRPHASPNGRCRSTVAQGDPRSHRPAVRSTADPHDRRDGQARRRDLLGPGRTVAPGDIATVDILGFHPHTDVGGAQWGSARGGGGGGGGRRGRSG